MIKNYSPITSAYNPTTVTSPAKSTAASSSELVSSFKEIFSTMMAMNSLSSTSQSSGMGMGSMGMSDLMAPLMLLLLERLVEQQVEQDPDSTGSLAAALSGISTGSAFTSQGPKPTPSGRPIEGGVLTQGSRTGHNALDFGIPVGTPVQATMDGRITYAGWNDQGYGNLVIVENGEYSTYYAHLSSIPVSVGDTVTAGTTIGLSGNTGNSTGPHLHYEIRKNKVRLDPTALTLGTSV